MLLAPVVPLGIMGKLLRNKSCTHVIFSN